MSGIDGDILGAFAFLTEAGFTASGFTQGSEHGTVGVRFETPAVWVTVERGALLEGGVLVDVVRPALARIAPANASLGPDEWERKLAASGVAPSYELGRILMLTSAGREALQSGRAEVASRSAAQRERAALELHAAWLRTFAAEALRGDFSALTALDAEHARRRSGGPR